MPAESGSSTGAAGAEILVGIIQGGLVVGDEVVGHSEAPAIGVLVGGGRSGVGHDFDESVVIVAVAGKTVGVESRIGVAARAVARVEIKGTPVRLEGEAAATLPDTRFATVGRVVENPLELEPRRGQMGHVPGDHPTVIGTVVAVRGPRDINGIVDQTQGGPLVFAQGVELDDLLAGAVVGVGHVAVAGAVGVDRRVVDVALGSVADQVGRDRSVPSVTLMAWRRWT